jgi:hypothetical protein
MMPDVSSCFNADNSCIFTAKNICFSANIDIGGFGSVGYNGLKLPLGYIMTDNVYDEANNEHAGYTSLSNVNWNRSFPFEPRYQSAPRQLDISRSFVAKKYLPNTLGQPVVSITPTLTKGIIFICGGASYVNDWDSIVPTLDLFGDSSLVAGGLDPNSTGSMATDDTSRVLFGFGNLNTYGSYSLASGTLGTNHLASARQRREDPNGAQGPGSVQEFFDCSPVIRGWKYGVYSGIPTFNKAYWRRDRFGQFRDMLEQRLDTKFFYTINDRLNSSEKASTSLTENQGMQQAAVTVRFVDSMTKSQTPPENTFSNNLHFECTSSLPYFDGALTLRPPINPATLNKNVVSISSDAAGNVSVAASDGSNWAG